MSRISAITNPNHAFSFAYYSLYLATTFQSTRLQSQIINHCFLASIIVFVFLIGTAFPIASRNKPRNLSPSPTT